MKKSKKILVYGYGNPGRQDDGLGVMLSEMVGNWAETNNFATLQVDSNYQLNIEDAEEIKDKDIVIFADASIEDNISDFKIIEVEPSDKTEFTMHAVAPAFILFLCKSIYNVMPKTYLVHIKGYEWELKEGLTSKAKSNLEKAFSSIKDFIKNEI